jgi:predicted membrane channel-forming protein YqfA (hemolysin III family)
MLRAPNIAVFVIAGCLAMIGVLAALPIELPIPGINEYNAAWYVFLGWFILAASAVLPQHSEDAAQSQAG